jgi:hypothetical protein
MFSFSVSRCTEALCQKTIQLLVPGMLACVRVRNHDKRVADIVVRQLKRTKPSQSGYIQDREVWSSEEEANMWSGHFWICKFGTSPGSMTCVERKFELKDRKCRWDSALVVELWLHRVADDLSGLTFQEWDPSAGTDDTSVTKCSVGNARQLEQPASRGFPTHGS